jgi:octanoyl-[GcvH]:protein N-octanoyltransferase
MTAFGGPFCVIDDTEWSDDVRPSPRDFAAWAKQKLTELKLGDEAIFRIRRPRPTAAFSPQDTTHVDYELVKERTKARGFEPIERGTGGRLTLYDEKALCITLIASHAAPHDHMHTRFEILSAAIAHSLQNLGIDARVGELLNEYCPGKYSINAEGRIKLVGIAQRMNQRCYQMGAVVSVTRSDEACAGIAEAYRGMGLHFDPNTYGGIADVKPALSYSEVCKTIKDTVYSAITQV